MEDEVDWVVKADKVEVEGVESTQMKTRMEMEEMEEMEEMGAEVDVEEEVGVDLLF